MRSARANPRAATPSCSNIFSFLKCCGTRCIKEAGTLAQLTEAAQTGPVRSLIKRHRPHASFSALCELASCTGMTIQYGSRLSCSSAAASRLTVSRCQRRSCGTSFKGLLLTGLTTVMGTVSNKEEVDICNPLGLTRSAYCKSTKT